MRIAVVSDIHGNLSAFEAVLADLRETAPDLILHGGDLADNGSSPREIVDRIRDLGWRGVGGNTDEMLFRPASLEEFASQSSAPLSLWEAVREMAATTREMLGEERLAWLRALPRKQLEGEMALVHASPESVWRGPALEASDGELAAAYGPLHHGTVVYGHIHKPYIRSAHGITIVNSGSVSLSYDGDQRASYVLLDDFIPTIRRVEYDLNKEVEALFACGLPHAEWIAKTLQSARPEMP